MPRDKDLKRVVRKRMVKTGESYTTARARILEKPAKRTRPSSATSGESRSSSKPAIPTKATAPAARKAPTKATTAKRTAPVTPDRFDYASIGGMSDSVMAEKTGRTWSQWVDVLDGVSAFTMAHRDIAKIVNETYQVDGWWSQMVTVGYERIKGLRERGQRRTGTYEASKSKTFNVPVDELFDAWADAKTRKRWLKDANPKVRTATKPRSMRLGWEDGSIVAVWFESKGESKSVAGVQHAKLADRAASDRFKAYWTERLNELAGILKAR